MLLLPARIQNILILMAALIWQKILQPAGLLLKMGLCRWARTATASSHGAARGPGSPRPSATGCGEHEAGDLLDRVRPAGAITGSHVGDATRDPRTPGVRRGRRCSRSRPPAGPRAAAARRPPARAPLRPVSRVWRRCRSVSDRRDTVGQLFFSSLRGYRPRLAARRPRRRPDGVGRAGAGVAGLRDDRRRPARGRPLRGRPVPGALRAARVAPGTWWSAPMSATAALSAGIVGGFARRRHRRLRRAHRRARRSSPASSRCSPACSAGVPGVVHLRAGAQGLHRRPGADHHRRAAAQAVRRRQGRAATSSSRSGTWSRTSATPTCATLVGRPAQPGRRAGAAALAAAGPRLAGRGAARHRRRRALRPGRPRGRDRRPHRLRAAAPRRSRRCRGRRTGCSSSGPRSACCWSASPRGSGPPRRTPPGRATTSTRTGSCSGWAPPTSGAGLASGMVVNGSLSKTAVNGGAGAKSQVSGLTVAVLTVVTLLFLTGLFEKLPEATLAAVVIAAVDRAGRHPGPGRLYRVWTGRLGGIYGWAARADFLAALAAMLGVLVFDTLPGLVHRHRRVAAPAALPGLPAARRRLGPRPASGAWVDVERHPDVVAATPTWWSSAWRRGCSSPTPTTSATPFEPAVPASRAVVSTRRPHRSSTSPPPRCSPSWPGTWRDVCAGLAHAVGQARDVLRRAAGEGEVLGTSTPRWTRPTPLRQRFRTADREGRGSFSRRRCQLSASHVL